jgi:hypothetical protein
MYVIEASVHVAGIRRGEPHHVEASRWLKEEFDNGEEYYNIPGRRLQVLPGREKERPAPEFIEWHKRTYAIIRAAMEVHRELGCGFLEPGSKELARRPLLWSSYT